MYFYAASTDLLDVARLVLDETDCLLCEGSSEINQPLRKLERDDLGPWIDHQQGVAELLAWSPSMRQQMRIHSVTLKTVDGGVRQMAQGWGLIQVLLVDIRDGKLARSRVVANSESRARRWEDLHEELGPVDAWDWSAVERILRRIERLIRVRLVVARQGSNPMLTHARDAASSGIKLAG